MRPYPQLSHGRPVREAEVPAAWSGSHLARSYMILAYLIACRHKYSVYAICALSLFFRSANVAVELKIEVYEQVSKALQQSLKSTADMGLQQGRLLFCDNDHTRQKTLFR